MDCRHPIGLPAIGNPCASQRWQDHPHVCGGFFVGIRRIEIILGEDT